MDERVPLLPSTPAPRRPHPSPLRYVALLGLPALCGVYAVLSTLFAPTPAGLAVEQPLDRAADLIPFPFDRPFVCPLDHSHDPPNRWRVITHNASCAVPDPAQRRSDAPGLVPTAAARWWMRCGGSGCCGASTWRRSGRLICR